MKRVSNILRFNFIARRSCSAFWFEYRRKTVFCGLHLCQNVSSFLAFMTAVTKPKSVPTEYDWSQWYWNNLDEELKVFFRTDDTQNAENFVNGFEQPFLI